MEQDASTLFLDETDLVKILSTGVLATVEHIGGETSSDESDDDEDHGHHPHLHFHHHGHFFQETHTNGEQYLSDGLPLVGQVPHPAQLSRSNQPPLITRYADDFSDDGEEREPDDGLEHPDDHEEGRDDAVPDEGPDDLVADDGEDADRDFEVPIGSALVTRIDNGEDLVVPILDLQVIDRSLAPGQLVLSAVPGDTNLQSGTVRDIKKTVIVRRMGDWDGSDPNSENGTFELSAERLTFFSEVRVDGYVVYRNWLGVVEFLQEDVFVEFPCGSLAVVPGHPGYLQPDDPRVSPRRNPGTEGFFFPGMRVTAPPRVWRDASWLRGRYRRQRTGVVRTAKMTNVGVQWMAARQNLDTSPDDPPPQAPPEIVPYAEVRALDAFRSLWWRAGDRALLVPEQAADEEQWVEAVPTVHVPVIRDERAIARPSRPVRRHTSRGNGRLIAAHRRAREMTAQEEPNRGSAGVGSDPSAVLQVVSTRTVISVLWQNGVLEEGIPSVNLRINEHPGAFDFWPGLIVTRAGDNAEHVGGPTGTPSETRTVASGESEPHLLRDGPRELGESDAFPADQLPSQQTRSNRTSAIVVRALLSERTAVVRWQKPNSLEYFSDEEELSVYDLTALADYDMQLGDTVLLVAKDPSVENGGNGEPRWVGEIVGKGIGDIRVRWLGGDESTVTPEQIIVVSDDSDDESEEEESEYDGVADEGEMPTEDMLDPAFRANWEIAEYVPAQITEAVNDELESVFETRMDFRAGRPLKFFACVESADAVVDAALATASTMFEPLRQGQELSQYDAIQLAHSVGVRVLTSSLADAPDDGRPGADSPHPTWIFVKDRIRDGIEKLVAESQHVAETSPVSAESVIESDAGGESGDMRTMNGTRGEPSEVTEEEPFSNKGGPSAQDGRDAPRFEVVERFENHFFGPRSSSSTGQAHRPGFAAIVMKEYSRLRRNLPPGIYVHGSESQQDLIRAAIIGPPDTPYENVLFYFDIFLPLMYPAEPPKVHFWSHGRRLNPNLYEDGKVCLSILGTWDGDDVEQWDSRNSNVLRVLLSLQAMVFVEQPYYNEAGYEKQMGTLEGRNNSRTYNESALLLCMRHLLQSVRPGGTPKDFEELSRAHYLGKSNAIIERLRTLSSDSDAQQENDDASCPEGVQYTSRGFKRSLKELIPRVGQGLNQL